MRELRRQYHAAMLEFLKQQPAQWQVSAAFSWSMGSWDPQGMRDAEFTDQQMMYVIVLHKSEVSGD